MKKFIFISLIASTALFADMMTDMATKAATDHVKKEATKAVSSEVTKATATQAKSENNATEKKEESASMKDQAIDAAAGHVKDKTGVEKSITKSAIKSVI
ncbi:hypothetical protein [Sulfurovum riftiae]|uniref:Uncharacterized protein n=1 Tax=Sulfurovum riftiae TaxID=1630136 RepID=A0A151CEW7_9BACT|nr:hypothetical protein [Sulfurovum riftiae]KYJ86056.1 hypothetical protein AS592_01405 [Sulfurovum riftiae]